VGHKPSGKAAGNDDSLATAQASITNMVDSSNIPPSASTAIQGSSMLAPVDVEANDLASMADTVASNAVTVHSAAAPPATDTTIKGSSQLAPIDVDIDDLASMADMVDASVESSLDSSSNSSISEDPLGPSSGVFTHHVFYHSDFTSAAPPEDMETEPPDTAPDPVRDDDDVLDHPSTLLLSVGDQQQTLGDGPPMPPQGTHYPRSCTGSGWV